MSVSCHEGNVTEGHRYVTSAGMATALQVANSKCWQRSGEEWKPRVWLLGTQMVHPQQMTA